MCLASTGCGSKVTDYLTQVGGTVNGNNYSIAGHGTGGERPQNPYITPGARTTLYSLGGTAIPGGSTLIDVGPGPGSGAWGNPIINVSGADGWFQLTPFVCGFGGCHATLAATISQHAPLSFVLRLASEQSGYSEMPIRLARVGTGDVQVNLSWDASSGIDLHVIEPSGEELYEANKGPSATGGQFDLGPEGDCAADGRTENIFWPSGRAPRGSYSVLVAYRSACGRSSPYQTRYAVTVNVKGREPQVFYGTFLPADAGPSSLRTITTFNY